MKGNKLIDDHIQIAVNLLRYKSHGRVFEVAIDPDKAVAYKEGEPIPIEEIVKANDVFADMKKGLHASEDALETVFNTTDVKKIQQIMLEKGEIQFTQKYRTQLREKKFNKIVHLIHMNAIHPKTGLPHPENRIRSAIEEAKVKINNLKKAQDQVDDIVKKLLPIIPISMEKVTLQIHIPPQFSAALQGSVRSFGKLLREDWGNDGSVIMQIKIPAGLQETIIDKINSASHGGCSIDKIKK